MPWESVWIRENVNFSLTFVNLLYIVWQYVNIIWEDFKGKLNIKKGNGGLNPYWNKSP